MKENETRLFIFLGLLFLGAGYPGVVGLPIEYALRILGYGAIQYFAGMAFVMWMKTPSAKSLHDGEERGE